MIDERINKSLQELESQLKEVESARKQVESTVNSFDGLNTTTSNYVESLSSIKTKLDEVVELISEDYKNKVIDFENDRTAIVSSANDVIKKMDQKVDEVTKSFDTNVINFRNKLVYLLIISGLNTFLIVLFIILWYLK